MEYFLAFEEASMFKGSIVALVTPMHRDESVAKQALQELVEWHIQAKTTAIVAGGTTGESATLELDEHYEIISLIVKQAAGRIPVIAGTGTSSTRTTLKLIENAKRAKAHACLVVTPYYNKPSQDGLYQHYKVIAKHSPLPIILYNVPNRTGCDILPETVERLAKISNIIGIKEATGKLERAQNIMQRCDKKFAIYSGDDATALSWLCQGAQGVISVTANITPEKMQAMCDAALAGNKEEAEKINAELTLLHKCLFIESNPMPTKWALHAMGKIPAGIRLPLIPLDAKYHQAVKEAMQQAGAI
jgi:4-hydroxy-tetrahydrodipicolinate synthase